MRVCVLRLLSAIIVTLWTATGWAQFAPQGWTQQFDQDQVVVRSPSDASGEVVLIAPLMTSFEGDYEIFVINSARQFAQTIGGAIVRLDPIRYIGGREELGGLVDIELRADAGIRVHVRVYSRRGAFFTGNRADLNTVQFVAIIAPEAIRNGEGEQQARWNAANKHAQFMLSSATFALTQSQFERLRDHPLNRPGGVAAAQQPAAQSTAQTDTVIWSALGNGRGVTFVSPCSADGAIVVGIVRRREYLQMVNLPAMLADESRDTVRAWSGGTDAGRFGPMAQQGNLLAITVEFNTAGGRMFGWFGILKRSDNFIQRGYALAPATLARDRRVELIRAQVQQMMLGEEYGELPVEGTAPAPSKDIAIEGIFSLSGLALALQDQALTTRAIEIALFKNGGATETAFNLQGVWRRVPGGYSIEFSGAEGYVARVSETCRTTATVSSRPAPPPAVYTTAAGQGCTSSGIEINFPRAYSQTVCSMLGGQRSCRQETRFADSKTTVQPSCR
jgi:hypothetical protein